MFTSLYTSEAESQSVWWAFTQLHKMDLEIYIQMPQGGQSTSAQQRCNDNDNKRILFWRFAIFFLGGGDLRGFNLAKKRQFCVCV